ncbi:DUF1660 family phage protein [Paenibacillus sp. FSL H7-0690]
MRILCRLFGHKYDYNMRRWHKRCKRCGKSSVYRNDN